MARPQGRNEQAEVREDWREEADDTHQGAVRGLPWYVYMQLHLSSISD